MCSRQEHRPRHEILQEKTLSSCHQLTVYWLLSTSFQSRCSPFRSPVSCAGHYTLHMLQYTLAQSLVSNHSRPPTHRKQSSIHTKRSSVSFFIKIRKNKREEKQNKREKERGKDEAAARYLWVMICINEAIVFCLFYLRQKIDFLPPFPSFLFYTLVGVFISL